MKVLVAYDGSSSADAAIEDLRTAGLPQTGKALVVSVGNSGAASSGALGRFDECRALAKTLTNESRVTFRGWTVWSEGLRGQASEVLLDVCGWWHPDLLVVGSHGRSRAGRFLMGSVSLDLVHQAPCSVRVVRDGRRSIGDEPLRMLIGHDGSTEADAVIRSVACRSWPADTEVHVISVVQTLTPATVATLEFNTCVQEPAYTVVREVDEREQQAAYGCRGGRRTSFARRRVEVPLQCRGRGSARHHSRGGRPLERQYDLRRRSWYGVTPAPAAGQHLDARGDPRTLYRRARAQLACLISHGLNGFNGLNPFNPFKSVAYPIRPRLVRACVTNGRQLTHA